MADMQNYEEHTRIRRLLKGDDTQEGQFPFEVEIFCTNQTKFSLCSGSLISAYLVLTAAHCLVNMTKCTRIKMGHVIKSDTEAAMRSSNNWYMHPLFNQFIPETYGYDIALIILNVPANLTEKVRPIQLPSHKDRDDMYANRTVTVFGWGKIDAHKFSQKLLHSKMVILPRKQCKWLTDINADVEGALMCAKGKKQTICEGDSGAPMILDEGKLKDSPIQIGLASFSNGKCADSKTPQTFVRVAAHLDWIETVAWMENGTKIFGRFFTNDGEGLQDYLPNNTYIYLTRARAVSLRRSINLRAGAFFVGLILFLFVYK